MAANLGSAYIQVRGDLSSLNKQLVANFHPSKLGKLGKTAGVAIGAGLAVGVGGAAAGKALFDIGKSFDDQFDKIRVGTGQTGKALEGLEGDFKAVLKTVPDDMETVGTAVTELNKRLGLTGVPLQRFSRQLTTLSRITKTDLSTNIEAVARAFEDWEVPVKAQTKTLDGLFRLGQKSGASVEQLASSVQKFGSPLRILGFSLGQAASIFATFERAGVNTQTMVPGLKLAIANLIKPSKDLETSMKELGISAGKPEEGLKKVFALLGDKSNLSNTEKTSLAMEVFGKRAGADMAEAVRQGRFEVDEMMKAFGRGDSIRKAGRDTEDFSEKWKRLKNTILVGIEPVASRFFDSISRDMARIGKVLSDPKLSTEEKWDKIGDVLSSRLESGIEIAAETAGRLAPKVATAFLKGFVNAPALVQLLAGVWVLAKGRKLLAAFGLLGAQSGAAFGAGVGTGAAGGAAGGAAAGGMAGLATKMKGLAGKAGFVGVGLVAADLVLNSIEARVDARSKDLSDRLKGLGATPETDLLDKAIPGAGLGKLVSPLFGGKEADQAKRLKSILDDVKNSHAGITAEAAKEATQLAKNLDLTRQQRNEVQRALDAGRNKAATPVFDVASAQAEVEKLGRLTPNLINQLSTQLEDLPRKTRPKFAQAVLDWATELKRDGKIKGSLASLKNVIEGEVDGVGNLSIQGPKRLKTRLAAGFESMVAAVADPTSRMAQIVQTYLEAFGASGIDKISGAIAKDKASRKKGHRGGLAKGGFLQGQGRQDTIPIMAAPGEAVLNRHQQQPVETALRQTYGYGLGDLFKRERKPHFMAKGGFIDPNKGRGKAGGIVPIPGQPGESIHQSILSDVMALIRRYKLKVTDGYAPSGHAAGGEHPKGLAIDAIPGAGGSWDLVDKLAKWAEPSQGAPREPFRWVGYDNDPNHGRGNHLHLSWGGGGKGVDIAAPKLPGIKITGRSGVTKDLAKAATSQVRKAAQSFMDDQAGATAPVGTSSDPGGDGGGSPAQNRRLGRQMMRRMWPDSQWRALSTLWQGESGWKTTADNPSSSAYGIPQSLPGSKMASAGKDWRNNPATQIKWGLRYIKDRYGSPSRALSAWKGRSPHWYSEGGFVDSLREMYGGGFVAGVEQPAFRKADKPKQPKGLKKPPKGGGPSPGKGYNWDAAANKWVKRRGQRKRGDGFQLKQLDFFNTALDKTIPTIEDRIGGLETTFDLSELEHYPDERVVPRLQREGHNIQKIGDSFIDWSAVEQSKSQIGQILGQGFQLIGTPFGAAKGVMEYVKDALAPLQASLTGMISRLTSEVDEIRQQVRANLREIRRNEKEIDTLDGRMSKERDRKKPDKEKLKRWNEEKDERQDKVKSLRKQNRALTGESEPSGDLSSIDKGRLGESQTRLTDTKTALEDFTQDKEGFVGASGIGGDFASSKAEIARRVKELGTLTTERITEAVSPTTTDDGKTASEDIKNFLAALGDLRKQFGSNFQSLPGFQRGGIIPGFGSGDKIPLLAEPGEGFINKTAVTALGGPQAIERINRVIPRFQTGGVVAPISPRGAQTGVLSSEDVTRLEKAIRELNSEPRVVNKNIDARHTFATVPKDEHIWSRNIAHELEAAV